MATYCGHNVYSHPLKASGGHQHFGYKVYDAEAADQSAWLNCNDDFAFLPAG